MLLSVDWDYFSGCAEHVFDAPIWGTTDTQQARTEAWKIRAQKRDGDLSKDFPILEDWVWLKQFTGLPTFVALSHTSAYVVLQELRCTEVLNLDSHHDLYNQHGDATILRPGNWAGLALQHGLVQHYTCIYPEWHLHLPVAEGFDLERTWDEIGTRFSKKEVWIKRMALQKLELPKISALLLVQSPAWTNPQHDKIFFEICNHLNAQNIAKTEAPMQRDIF